MEVKKFEITDFLIQPNDPQLKYVDKDKNEQRGIGWGQRKLGMMLLQFLNFYWDPIKVPKPIVVYIGASPGTNIEYIASKCYPMIEFHLYDIRPINIKSSNVKIYPQLFTDEDAYKWANRNDILLISDIRSVTKHKVLSLEQEQIIMKDNEMQKKWYEIIKPVKASLKFRLPFPFQGYQRMSNI